MRILTAMLLCLSGFCAAQPQADYLVTSAGDSLRGQIAFYFTALDSKMQPIVPQQIHFKKEKESVVLTSQQISAFEYDYKWGVAEKAKQVKFLSNPNFRANEYFYELVWASDTVQLVRTYEMGSPPRKRQSFQFFHLYYFIKTNGQILQEVSPENLRPLCQQYLSSETAFLAALAKKRKVSVYTPHTGFSKVLRELSR